MKTLAEYIAERRRILEECKEAAKKDIGVVKIEYPYGALVSESSFEMSKVLDMLEKTTRVLTIYSKDKYDPSRALSATVVLEELEKMVNE